MIDLCIYLMISKLPISQVWFLLLNLANAKPCYLKYFVYFFSFWYSYYAYVTLFKIVQPFLDILFSYFLRFAFSVECFHWHNFRLTHFFLHYFQTLDFPSKAFFISFTVFFFIFHSLQLLILPFFSCMLSTFHIGVLRILTIVISNFWYDNPKMFAIFYYGSVTCFVSLHCAC